MSKIGEAILSFMKRSKSFETQKQEVKQRHALYREGIMQEMDRLVTKIQEVYAALRKLYAAKGMELTQSAGKGSSTGRPGQLTLNGDLIDAENVKERRCGGCGRYFEDMIVPGKIVRMNCGNCFYHRDCFGRLMAEKVKCNCFRPLVRK